MLIYCDDPFRGGAETAGPHTGVRSAAALEEAFEECGASREGVDREVLLLRSRASWKR